MPIFQPGGTNAGYRGPAKTLTIKALQDRQAAMQAASEASAANAAPIVNAWQGAGALVNSLGDSMQQSRVANQEADARAQLAGIMAGIDPNKGASMEQIAAMQQLDPEFANKEYMRAMEERAKIADREDTQEFTGGQNDLTRQAEADRQAALFGQQTTLQEDAQTHDIGVAETKVGTDRVAADEAADRAAKLKVRDAALAPEMAKLNAALEAGTLDPVQYTQAVQQLNSKTDAEIASSQATTAATEASIGHAPTPEDVKAWPILQDPASVGKYAMVDGKPELINPVQKPGDMFTPGQAAADAEFGKNLRDIRSSVSSGAVKAATQVNKAISLLKNNDITGFRQAVVEETMPKYVSALYNPQGRIAQSAIRETVAQTLRQTLGAQFTQQEGENLMDRAFDMSLGEDENIRRAQLLLDQITQVAAVNASMLEHWDANNGTTAGYKGPADAPDVMQTLRDLAAETEAGGPAPAPDAGGGDGGFTIRKKGG